MTGHDTAPEHARDDLLALATDIASDAAEVLVRHAGRADLAVATKTSETDPVSAADHASERRIGERIRAARPDDGILGEESSADRDGTSGLRWVVDPLDGTVNFLYGIPQWCVSVAVEDDDGPLVGVVTDPVAGDTFRAARGRGAEHNGTPIAARRTDDVAASLVATGFSYDPAIRADWARHLPDLVTRVRDVRRFGSAALDLCWTAIGRCDGYVEFTLERWDWAAASLVVSEAGGTVSRWELTLGGGVRRGVIAGGPAVHDHLAGWLSGRGGRRIPGPYDDLATHGS